MLWTGSFYAIVYEKLRDGDYRNPCCLSMRRFDSEGAVVGPDWIYNPLEDLDISSFDLCWNGIGFGLSWVQGQSVYFLRLNSDGKPLGSPVLVCDGCLPFFDGAGPIHVPPVRIGCGHGGYLLGYQVEVGFLETQLWFQRLDETGLIGGGIFFGEGDVLNRSHAAGMLRSFHGGWSLLHWAVGDASSDLILEGISDDIDFLWRSCLSSGNSPPFDYDLDEGCALVIFREGYDLFSMAKIDLENGEVESVYTIQPVPHRVASIGEGRAALLKIIDVEGISRLFISVVGPGGLESEPVPVLASITNQRYDLAWTGSEVGVVIELDPTGGGPSDYYLQRFVP